MFVAMVKIGIVRVAMHEPLMAVRVRVRLAGWIGGQVVVLVMDVVNVAMRVLEGFVHMFVIVRLG
jgi:hypothetical protein